MCASAYGDASPAGLSGLADRRSVRGLGIQRDLDPVVVERRAAAQVGIALGDGGVDVAAGPEQLRPLLLERERDARPRAVVDDSLGAERSAVVVHPNRRTCRDAALARVD